MSYFVSAFSMYHWGRICLIIWLFIYLANHIIMGFFVMFYLLKQKLLFTEWTTVMLYESASYIMQNVGHVLNKITLIMANNCFLCNT